MNVLGLFQPRPTLSEEETTRGLRMMTLEGVFSMSMSSVTTSGVLAAFALALGANNLEIGILASIPFITQPLQIPAILLVERLRRRKAIAVASWLPAQLMWVPIALIPIFVSTPGDLAVAMLLIFMAIRGAVSSATNCAWNSWVRDLIPQQILGRYFSRRLALATIASVLFGLVGAFFVEWWQGRTAVEDQVFGYTLVLLTGAVFLGLASPLFMSQMPEPLMAPLTGPQPSLASSLSTPVRDRNFRQLLNFLFTWGFAANLAIPFFTIYMLQRLGFSLSAVIALNILAQLTNVLFLRVWGPFADRFGSKPVLSACVSLYLLVIIGWAFTTMPERYFLTVPLVVVLQVFAGIAAAGVNVTVGTIGLKLAPQGAATSYMAAASLATNLGAGLGPIAGGVFADFFSVRDFSIAFRWDSPGHSLDFSAIQVTGFDFLFAISFLIGLLALNTLTTIREEGEVERGVVLEELLAPTRDMARGIGSMPGVRLLGEFPYAYLRRVPGMDVALGVTAYQVAASARTAATAASRTGSTLSEVADRVGGVVVNLAGEVEDIRNNGANLALYATKGAVNALGDVAGGAGQLANGAVRGVLSALGRTALDERQAVRYAARGAVRGALESGGDAVDAANGAIMAAREMAEELGLDEQEATAVATDGALEELEVLGPEEAQRIGAALQSAVSPSEGLTGDDSR